MTAAAGPAALHITAIPTPFFAANCYVVHVEGADRALVVDPSAGVQDQIHAALTQSSTSVGAVLLTHGHPDHIWDAAEVQTWTGPGATTGDPAPVWLPGPDMYRMDDPTSFVQPLPADLTVDWRKPVDLREVPGATHEYLPGLRLLMIPAPGHTEGSAIFLGEGPLTVSALGATSVEAEASAPWAFSGDVVFAGSVGRTDLSGGDEVQMRHTLRTLANALDPATVLLPGHGTHTTMEIEKRVNPYLRRAMELG